MSKQEVEQVVNVEETWREVLNAYESLKIAHETFCKAAEGVDLNQAGPGLREALQRLFHRRRFSMFLEDLLYEDFRKGGISQLVPQVPQEKEEKQPSKPPASFKGKKKDSPTEE